MRETEVRPPTPPLPFLAQQLMPLSPKQKKTIKSLLKDGWTSPRLSFGASGQVYLTPPPNSEAVNARVFKNGSAWVTFPPSGNDRYATVKKFPPPTDQ